MFEKFYCGGDPSTAHKPQTFSRFLTITFPFARTNAPHRGNLSLSFSRRDLGENQLKSTLAVHAGGEIGGGALLRETIDRM